MSKRQPPKQNLRTVGHGLKAVADAMRLFALRRRRRGLVGSTSKDIH